MLKSMTAYAGAEMSAETISVSVEIRSYNSRHLDCVLRIPPAYAAFEEQMKKQVASTYVRGRVEVRIKIQDTATAAGAFDVDLSKAQAYLEAVDRLKDHFKLAEEATLDRLLALPGIVIPAEAPSTEGHWTVITACLQDALDSVETMRCAEGDYLEQDLLQRLDTIESGLRQIDGAAAGLLPMVRDKLATRIEALTQAVVDLDPGRIAQEAAILADRSDISEEIVRASSHIQQFRDIMQADEPGGRKLNFLLQEFNREFNTMGSKIGQAAVSHVIVDIKAEIEKMREQVQNIE
jgi:uncharacterized protein (TIGR00255 family)